MHPQRPSRRDDGFPADVRQLVYEHVSSIGALDLILLLRGGRQDSWSVDEVSRRLRCPPRWAAQHLEQMRDSGLLDAEDDGRYAFRPRDARLHAAVDALAQAYAERQRDVVTLILSVPGA
jgi:DNA-binding IclR family transcriptional regulator